MQYDKEGFRYPVVNENLCVACGLCEKKCPAYDTSYISSPYLKTFAGYTTNLDILMNTTSGGFATALSKLAIDNGYTVAGVKYNQDFIKSEYTIVDTNEGLDALRGSKYVQSEKNGIFKSIKFLLKGGRKVLFIGCPCDIAGLYSVVGNLDTDNLLTCELVCMGVTSPGIAEKFRSYVETKYKRKLTYICARSKRNGWFVPTLEMRFEEGGTKTEPLFASYYGRGFQIYNRPSCFNCKYRGATGMADIRIGDFWGIKREDPFWNKNGVSCIFAKTEKGLSAIQKLSYSGYYIYEVDYTTATTNNMSSVKNKGRKYEELRNEFARIFLEKGLVEACRQTADMGFRLKRIIPASVQPIIKKVYHLIRDKKR